MAILRRPILISAWSNRVVLDAVKAVAWPSEVFVLQPGKPSARSFVDAAIATADWPQADVMLGASVVDNLHAVTVGAISNIVAKRTGNPRRTGFSAADPMAEDLADWLLDVARDPARFPIPVKQLSYVFASGGHRARAIARTLSHITHRPIARVIDVGTAAGMIPWLLRADLPHAAVFDLFEPEKKFHAALDRLWRHRGPTQSYSLSHTPAEHSEFGTSADLIMLCQCLLHLSPDQRRAVLQRAWHALNPGGVLLVNEKLCDAATPSSERGDLVHRDELLSIMPGAPSVFSRRSDWTKPEDLRRVSASALGYSGIVVSIRDS
ncbi:MAG TPA: class I SAM-dependent methyltransferase [Rhizomicrobium sp.]|jgi:DNA-directed RNA polymerase specialized sigma24 family protein